MALLCSCCHGDDLHEEKQQTSAIVGVVLIPFSIQTECVSFYQELLGFCYKSVLSVRSTRNTSYILYTKGFLTHTWEE